MVCRTGRGDPRNCRNRTASGHKQIGSTIRLKSLIGNWNRKCLTNSVSLWWHGSRRAASMRVCHTWAWDPGPSQSQVGFQFSTSVFRPYIFPSIWSENKIVSVVLIVSHSVSLDPVKCGGMWYSTLGHREDRFPNFDFGIVIMSLIHGCVWAKHSFLRYISAWFRWPGYRQAQWRVTPVGGTF